VKRLVVVFAATALVVAAAAFGTVFTNPAVITMGGPAGGPLAGSPYPSPITVSGLRASLQTVTVTLNDVSHTFPDDLGLLLVSPTGAKMLFLSDACGNGDLSTQDFTFSDAGAAVLADATPPGCAGGTFRPTDYDVSEDADLLAPAPTGPYPERAPAGSATLNGVFGGSNPNGTWNLWVLDDSGGDGGSFAGGWSLDITNPPTAVSVREFHARPRGLTVSVRWRTTSEAHILAFDVLRVRGNGTVRVNAKPIAARAAGSTAGASYALVDRAIAPRSSYTYLLRVTRSDGSRVIYGSSSVATL
jgi:hypothetical protein